MRNKTFKFGLFVAFVIFASLISPIQTFAMQNEGVNNCISSDNSGWISCPVIDSIGNSVEHLYAFLIENWLAFNPKLLAFQNPTDPGASVFLAWQYFQTLANILLFLYLIVIIISQITGVGISNYGIKKALPRVVLAAVLINLSYFICQAAIDLANIVGAGIFDVLDKLVTDAGIVATGKNDTPYSIAFLAILVLLVGLVVKLASMSPALISVALAALVSAVVAVIFLFVVLGLRQVLAVLLVAVSPVAILCSTVPGLKTVYNKWFGLMKGVLMAYPICSVLIGGGSLCAQILYDAWGGDSNFFAAVACMVITVAPFFFIPSMLRNSIGALDGIVDKVRNGSGRWKGIGGLAQRGFQNSDLNRRLNLATEKKKTYRRSGIKTDFWGNARRDGDGNLVRSTHAFGKKKGQPKGDVHYYDRAMAQLDKENQANMYAQNPGLMKSEEDAQMIKQYESAFKSKGLTVKEMGDNLSKLCGSGGALAKAQINAGSSGDSAELREVRAQIAAYSHSLAGTASGRAILTEMLGGKQNDPSKPSMAVAGGQIEDFTQAAFSGFSMAELGELSRSDPLLGNYGMKVKTRGLMYAGAFSASENQTYTSDMLKNLTSADWAMMDDGLKRDMLGQAATGFTIDSNGNIQGSFQVNDDDYATNLARLVNGATSNVNNLAYASVSSQGWMNAFINQRDAQVAAAQAGLAGQNVAQLAAFYANSANGGSAINMAAAAAELRRIDPANAEATLETWRRAAEVPAANANAKAATAYGRARKN